jgi:hypothetical protein
MTLSTARLGWYYNPEDVHYTQVDLATWLPELKALGAHWLVMKASPARAVPEAFILGLKEAGIEPVIHIPSRVGSLTERTLKPLLGSYQQWGVRYVIVYDRPNLRINWDSADWGRKALVERFIDHCLPLLIAQADLGLEPVFPALEPGGDYWDLAFLEAALESIARRGQRDLLERLTLATYAWTYGKPIEWGTGGSAQWPEAQPYHTPPGCENHLGFNLYEWYAEVASKVLGEPLPMLVVAGGALPSGEEQSPKSDPHIEQNVSIVRSLGSTQIPETLLNFSFYHLWSTPENTEHASAWFHTQHEPRPIVAAARRLSSLSTKSPPPDVVKPLSHYLLLPEKLGDHSDVAWQEIYPFVLSQQPVVGFSVHEARMAKKVTIYGDAASVPSSVEQALQAEGCTVERLTDEPEQSQSRSPFGVFNA